MPHALTPHPELLTSQPTSNLSSDEESHLEELLAHKLRGIPNHHIPAITLRDILHRTPKTKLANIPPDINLEWFLRNRSTIDKHNNTPLKDDQAQHPSITRAIFFYRLSTTHQFQRYHDTTRWNLYIATALLTQHTLTKHGTTPASPSNTDTRIQKTEPPISRASARFLTRYLAAVLEQHRPFHHPSNSFTARDSFIRLWSSSVHDLFAIRRSWARKAMQRCAKRVAREWEVEFERARAEMGSRGYWRRVGRFEGSVVPGRVGVWGSGFGVGEGGGHGGGGDVGVLDGEENELLAALRVPCSGCEDGGEVLGRVEDDDVSGICGLRTAIAAVQSMRPRDMLPVLMRLFPLPEDAE